MPGMSCRKILRAWRRLRPEPCPVHGEAHGKALDGHIVHDLVVAALKERGIDHRERLQAFGGEAGGECHRVLLGDAHVKAALGKALLEQIKARA